MMVPFLCPSPLDINITKLQKAFSIVSYWLTNNGLEVQLSKIEIMHFTKTPHPHSPLSNYQASVQSLLLEF
jgi:hypothetical protein